MAYWINKAGNHARPNWRQFYCDSDADISNLPTSNAEGAEQDGDSSAHKRCAIGSECLSLGSTSVYVLNSADVWSKLG